ncbi:MAG TPA: ABC transporter permease [Planctomycetota bacterium]|jgi:molybdate transport system permease protein|nr:ABC transporter permease [Planctomycetota bacterium]
MTGDDRRFLGALAVLGGAYVLLIVAMFAADLFYTSPGQLLQALSSPEIRFSIMLTLVTSVLSALLSILVAIPLGYLLARTEFHGKKLLNAILDVPVVLPPLVVGLSLLILFQTAPGKWFERHLFQVTFAVPSVVLAQFSVAAAFAIRVLQTSFIQMSPRTEQVALTLGCTRAQAFFRVVLPEARRALLAAFAIAWARSLGEFGPVLVFSGATRMKTEVLSTTVNLELNIGRLEAAVAVSILMIVIAVVVLILLQLLGKADAIDQTVRR